MKKISGASSDIQVLGMGDGWLAVEKPAGMSVHNAPGEDLCSRIAEVIRKDAGLQEMIAFDDDFGVSPVHRIDKETSGVILLAVRARIFRYLAEQFAAGHPKKQYIATLHGRLDGPEAETGWGTWRWALSKTAGGRDNPQGKKPRLPSETRYRVLEYTAHYTLVEIELLTGRKHQIRRHAKLAGHPVVGDARYGSTRAVKYLQQHAGFDRLALHSRSLAFRPPGKKEERVIETPSLPLAMQQLLESDKASTV